MLVREWLSDEKVKQTFEFTSVALEVLFETSGKI